MSIYRKDVRHLDELDLYVLADLYDVKSHAVFHAIKKLICAGKRGAKDYEQDLMEAIESIERELQIIELRRGHMPDGDGWIEWKKGSSINSDEYPFVEVKLANGQIRMGKPSAYEWYVRGMPDDIVAYRKSDGFDEQRIDAIGQNGGEPHYEDWRLKINFMAGRCWRYAYPILVAGGGVVVRYSNEVPKGTGEFLEIGSSS